MQAIVPWTDMSGYTVQQTFYAFDPAGALAVLTQLAALSNATGEVWYTADPHAPVASGYAGGYTAVTDIADLTYKNNTTGGSLHIWVPAPTAVFQTDGETVDVAAITSLNTAILANALTPAGDPVDTYVEGYRRTLTKRNYK